MPLLKIDVPPKLWKRWKTIQIGLCDKKCSKNVETFEKLVESYEQCKHKTTIIGR